jgi:Rad3-related DNA helicase
MGWFHGDQRFCGLAAPTGIGKSLEAVLIAKMSGARTVILTATKGLMSQYEKDVAPLGGVLVKGQNNFSCALVPGITADQGPCHEGMSCEYKSTACLYRRQLDLALKSKLIITNYAYWLAQTRFSSGLGEVQLLVGDEAHLAFSAVESAMTVFLSRLDIEPLGISFPVPTAEDPALLASWESWQSWAASNLSRADQRVEEYEAEIKSRRQQGLTVLSGLSHAYRTSKSVSNRLQSMSSASGKWVIQKTYHGWRFTPRWVNPYGSTLFQTVPKVLLMSAILTPKTADSLGVPPEPENRAWIDVPSYFPPENTPIWHIPTARINYRTDDYGTALWVARIDQYIARRLDRKGIIFTVSYDRANLLLQRSRFSNIMVSHSTADVVRVVERFKTMDAPAILVSPSVTTGWDFDEETGVRWIGVGKVPWPDVKDPVMQARTEDDKDWPSFIAMGVFIQEAGRASRSFTQRCEVALFDDNFSWWWYKNKAYAPLWFQQRYRGSLKSVPEPLV